MGLLLFDVSLVRPTFAVSRQRRWLIKTGQIVQPWATPDQAVMAEPGMAGINHLLPKPQHKARLGQQVFSEGV